MYESGRPCFQAGIGSVDIAFSLIELAPARSRLMNE